MLLLASLAAVLLLSGVVGAARAASPPPLLFGIYPGGGAGTVGPAGQTAPEDPAKRLEALQQLRAPGQPFVVHLYASYTGPESPSPSTQIGREVAGYSAAGFQIELVLTYRAEDLRGFVEFVRSAVRSFGSNPAFVALQVTNEANVTNAPNAADGYYAGAQDALVQGVTAAHAEARARGFDQLRVGFNWAYAAGPGEKAFWRGLGERGGAQFRSAVDWVGLDIYPGTWGPARNAAADDLAAATSKAVLTALAALRTRFMPLAGLPPSVPLHVSENGYPTGPQRTEAMQVAVMRAAIGTVDANRAAYHVTDYRWFDLRDADSSSTSFEHRYGLLNDDYTPKRAFGVYRELVATLGGPGPAGT